MRLIGVLRTGETGCSAVDALIYNRDELEGGEDLPDDEFLLHYVHDRGYDSLKDVNGDFAGVIAENGCLTLFRDHVGVRPLYYYCDKAFVAYATDICDLAKIRGVDLTVNERQLWYQLNGYNPLTATETDFERIHCVPAGGYVVIRSEGGVFCLEEHIYWRPGQHKIRLADDKAYITEMRRLVEDAIRRRLSVFPGKVAAEFSGGLDSSVICILINRMGRESEHIVWKKIPDDWPLQPEDERIVLRDICEQERFTCSYLPRERYKTFDELVSPLVPPFANTSQLGRVSKMASDAGIHVVFSGQGGDEGVSHRANVLELLHHGEIRAFLREIWAGTRGRKWRLARSCHALLRQVFVNYPRRLRTWRSADTSPFVTSAFRQKMGSDTGAPLYFNMDAVRHIENGGLRMRPETAAYQAEPYGVRYVFPYEDFRLVDFAVSIPRHLFLRNHLNRWIYRQAFDDLMPESLRRVEYKDTPSLRNGLPPSWFDMPKDNDDSSRRENVDFLEYLLSRLNRSFWGNYLDFNVIEAMPKNHETNLFSHDRQYFNVLDIVYRCWLIQKLQECPKHEWNDI